MLQALRHHLFDRRSRRLEKRLQLALSAGGMAAWELQLRDRRAWWSADMYALHGLPPDGAPPPEDYYALVHAEDRERVRALVEESIRACADHAVQYRVCWPDGTVHWLEADGATLCDPDGLPEVVVGICRNIDARREEENNLQFLARASAELSTLTDYEATLQRIAQLAVPHFADWCAIDMLDDKGGLRRVAVAHVDPEQVRQAHALHERFPPNPSDPGGTWEVVRSARPELVPVITAEMLEATVRDPEQLAALRSLGLHSYMGVPLVANGRVLGVISFITSESRRVFTERNLTHASELAARAAVAIRNAELLEALRRSDAAKDVFLATLAHELRNPLAPIVNSLALLSRSDDAAAVLPRALEIMQRQTAQLTRLVDDLLDLARINSGKIELRRQPVDVRDVLRSAVESCQPLVDRRRHALAVELPGEPALADADPVRLAQVFANLLNNAAKYTPTGGRIHVRLAAEDAQLQLAVEDNGIGIAPELLPRVFELFMQAAHPSVSGQQGLGIGLYVVRGLVQMHGGSIRADSAGLGQGSRFTVVVPRLPPGDAAAPATDAERPAPTGGRKVLVVDDNVDAALTLQQLLGMLGHQTAVAHDGAAALARWREFGPDVVLLDIGLPDMDGYAVARAIRAEAGGATTLVALTGWGQAEDKRRAADAGFDLHWTKPVDPAKLDDL